MAEQEDAPAIGSVFGFSLTIVLLALTLFIGAANASSSAAARALAVLCAAILALMLAVRLWSRAGARRLEVVLSVDRERLFPGETFTLRADIANRKALPVRVALTFPHPDSLVPLEAEDGEAGLLPFERLGGSWPFRAERRGVYRLGPATLTAGDPLGLAVKEKRLPFEREIVVFPRTAPLSDFDLPFRDYFGIHPSKGIIEDPAWYEGTREYSGSRPAKNIHWKASARLAVLQEKIFEPTSHRKVFLALSSEGYRRANDEAGFEKALEVLAALASRFAETGASFAAAADCRVRSYPAVLPLGRGPEHLGATLELLARCVMEEGSALIPLLGAVSTTGAGFVVVARERDESSERFHSLPASKRDRILFLFNEDFDS